MAVTQNTNYEKFKLHCIKTWTIQHRTVICQRYTNSLIVKMQVNYQWDICILFMAGFLSTLAFQKINHLA